MKNSVPNRKSKSKYRIGYLILTVCIAFVLIVLAKYVLFTNKSGLPEIKQFLYTEGQFSVLSSTWGLKITVDTSQGLPKSYIIEWHATGGELLTWNASNSPNDITKVHNGYPMTLSTDANNGSILWFPANLHLEKELTLEAFVYTDENASVPFLYDKVILKSSDGISYSVYNK